MFLSKKINSFRVSALLFMSVCTFASNAQTNPDHRIKNQYPCAECAVYDNNGNDLRGFINAKKQDFMLKGEKVQAASAGSWGYVQIKNARVPSVNKQGELSYNQYIDATLAMSKTTDGAQATWWARECNMPKGALVYLKTEDKDKLSLTNVKYRDLIHETEGKKMTLVEYNGDTYNQEDYDALFKNYLLLPADAIKEVGDYKTLVDFYNGFLGKFSSVSDPLIENKSFITFLTINKVKYIAYFNVVHGKLAGKLMPAEIEYETDKEPRTKQIFKKLTGNVVFIYGDDVFGMEKTIIKYAKANNIKLNRKKTTDQTTFNEDK